MKPALALSGGSARGIAHLGTLKALETFGIKPGLIAGVSSGSVAGAFYASGFSPEEILAIVLKHKFWHYLRPGMRKGGVLSIRKTTRILNKYLGNPDFESLKIPLKVLAVDFISGETRVFDKGPVIPAILASSSIPMVFEPFNYEGRYYIDGGVLENIPLSAVAGYSGPYLSVDVMTTPPGPEPVKFRRVMERSIELITSRQPGIPDEKYLIKPLQNKYFPLNDLSTAKEMYTYSYTEALRWLELNGGYLLKSD